MSKQQKDSESGKALLVLVLVIPLLAYLLYRSLDFGVQIANVPNVSLQINEVLHAGGRPGYRTDTDGQVRLNTPAILAANVQKFNTNVRTLLDDQKIAHRTASASLSVLMELCGGGAFNLSTLRATVSDSTLCCTPRDADAANPPESPRIIPGTFEALATTHPSGPMTEAEAREPMRLACLKELRSAARGVCYEQLICYATRVQLRAENSSDENTITTCHCTLPNAKDVSPQGAANPGSIGSSSAGSSASASSTASSISSSASSTASSDSSISSASSVASSSEPPASSSEASAGSAGSIDSGSTTEGGGVFQN